MTTPKTIAYYIRSRFDEIIDEDREWLDANSSRLVCEGTLHPSREWLDRPRPVDAVISTTPRGSVAGISNIPMTLISDHLYVSLRPFIKRGWFVVGTARLRLGRRTVPSGFRTIIVHPKHSIDPYRGPKCQHRQCARCGLICSVDWSDSGIVERTIAGTHVFGFVYTGGIYVDDVVVQELSLRSRFPDLRLIRQRILTEPLDGDILPGDQSWDGTFHPQRNRLKGRL